MGLERDEHAALVSWLRSVAPLRWPPDCLDGGVFPFIVSHSAARRVGKGIGWAKQQGLQPGIPDFHIPIRRGVFAALWIELKRSDGRAVVAAHQAAWLAYLNLHGHCARVAYGCDAAIKMIELYMKGGTP